MPSGSTTEPTGSGDSPLADPDVRERLQPLPPSAKLIARLLAEHGPLLQADLEEASLLHTQTIQYALQALADADLVAVRPSLQDTHKQVYRLQQ